MLILSLTTDSLSLTLDEGSSNIAVVASFTDRNQSTGNVGVSDKELHTFTSAGTATIVASPGSTTTRNLKSLSVRNTHASTTTTVRVNFNANGTLYELFAATLYTGDRLEYTEGVGFLVTPLVTRLNSVTRMPSHIGFGLYGRWALAIAGMPVSERIPVKAGRTYLFHGVANLESGTATTTGCQIETVFQAAPATDESPTAYLGALIGANTASVTAAVVHSDSNTADGIICAANTSSIGQFLHNEFSGYFVPAHDGFFHIRLRAEIQGADGALINGAWLHVWEPTG